MPLEYTYLETPIGRLLLAGAEEILHYLGFPKGSMAMQPEADWQQNDLAFSQAKQQLSEYFAGTRQVFDLPLSPAGTEFQRQVWQALQDIPFGQTCSYGELAKGIDRPKAVRAVGAANGQNPIPVIIPCHRVIGSSGKLTGFGGGLDVKEYLLKLEGVEVPEQIGLWPGSDLRSAPKRSEII